MPANMENDTAVNRWEDVSTYQQYKIKKQCKPSHSILNLKCSKIMFNQHRWGLERKMAEAQAGWEMRSDC